MSEELKNCPFCHKKPAWGRHGTKGFHFLVCESCNIRTKSTWGEEVAIERWKNRPREAELVETIRELRSYALELEDNIADVNKYQIVTKLKSLTQQALDKTKEFK